MSSLSCNATIQLAHPTWQRSWTNLDFNLKLNLLPLHGAGPVAPLDVNLMTKDRDLGLQ
jgi:hypothetical protein